MCRKRADYISTGLPELSWSKEETIASLHAIHQHVTGEARDAIAWYLESKGKKKWGSRILRILASVSVIVAAVIPLLTGVVTRNGKALIDPVYASVALVAAAGFVAFDGLIGCSSGWMRYMKTELRINKLLQVFEMEWEKGMAGLISGDPDCSKPAALIETARVFVGKVAEQLLKEANDWARQLTLSLAEQEKQIKALREELDQAEEKEAEATGIENLEKQVKSLRERFDQAEEKEAESRGIENLKKQVTDLGGKVGDLEETVGGMADRLNEMTGCGKTPLPKRGLFRR